MAHQYFQSAPHYRPYRWASPLFQVGLQPIDVEDWLLIDEDYAGVMRAKRTHADHSPLHYYRSLPGSLPAQRELRTLVVGHLLKAHPGRFSLLRGVLRCTVDGQCWDLDDDSCEPLWQLSRFIQEDFMLLEQSGAGQQITAAANAYSSSGRLVASVGRDVRWCHEPVPELTALHGARIDRILASVHERALSARYNWQLTPLSSLFFPPDPHAANNAALRSACARLLEDPSRTPELLYLRVERQTLRRLPETRAVAFGIHTYSDPLSTVAEDPDAIRALLGLLKGYPDARLRYAEMHTLQQTVIRWLETLAVTRV